MRLLKLLRRALRLRRRRKAAPLTTAPKRSGLSRAVFKAELDRKAFTLELPQLMPGVVPKGVTSGIAMDSNFANFAGFTGSALSPTYGPSLCFLGFPYLAALATRAEFRQMASSFATELTREWIKLNSSETAGESTKKKITDLTKKLDEIGLQNVIRTAAEHDCYFGRAQLFFDIDGHDPSLPLIPSKMTIKRGTFKRVRAVEPMWTTPVSYNASNPMAQDFYKPRKWFVLGKEVHASRLLTVVTRPLPDMLKPAFNFAGMSLSQLAEPYVENWLRTRQSVSDLINNFSITALKTQMSAVLTGGEGPAADGTDLVNRAKLFVANRSNQGLMLLDKEAEELVQTNVPLSGLDKLQAQAQEQMCSVSRLPAIILTGISPTGLNASSEGEIRVFYDWIAAEQEAHWRYPIQYTLNILQLSMYGEIDPDITFEFVPLFQMSAKELAEIRTADANTAATLIDRGVIDASEQRERLARDPESGYQGLDLNKEIEIDGEEGNEDEEK